MYLYDTTFIIIVGIREMADVMALIRTIISSCLCVPQLEIEAF